jgi:hypothetical protein
MSDETRHVHKCRKWEETGECERDEDGTSCVCTCGAVLDMDLNREAPLDYAWRLPDGSLVPWPDPLDTGE